MPKKSAFKIVNYHIIIFMIIILLVFKKDVKA